MEWLNQHSGLLVLISAVLIVALLIFAILLMVSLRNRIAVQKLKFLGLSSVDFDTREHYAEITVGNKSLNEVGLAEFGLQNGITTFDLTALYKQKNGLPADSRVVIEQRSAITFRLTEADLRKALLDGEKKKLKKLRVYAIDLTGNRYRGNLSAIKKLLAAMLVEDKKGISGYDRVMPLPVEEKEPEKPAYEEPVHLDDAVAEEIVATTEEPAEEPIAEPIEEPIEESMPEDDITE